MANEKVTLLDLSFDTSGAMDGLDALIAKSIELAKTKEQLSAALKDEKKQLDDAGKAFKAGSLTQDEYRKIIDSSTKSQVDLKKQMLEVNTAIASNNSAIKTNTTLLTSEQDSVNALRAQLAANTKELNSMSAATRNNTDAGKAMVIETKEISDKLKEMESAIGDNRRNVGNYSESIQQAIGSTQGLSGATAALAGGLSNGINIFKTAWATLKANPLILIVSIVLSLVSAIEKLISRNSEMAARMKAAFAPFEVIFSRIHDEITTMLEGVVKAFEWVSNAVINLLDKLGLITEATREAAKAARELSMSENDIYEAETDNLVILSRMSRELAAQKIIVGDQLKSTKERNDAAKKGLALLGTMEKFETDVLRRKYEQIKAQNALSVSTKEDRREEMQALANLQAKQAEYTDKRKELENQMSGLIVAETAKRAAAAKAANDKAAANAIKKAKEVEDAKKALQESTIKAMQEQLTALDLKLQEGEVKDTSLQTRIDNEKQFAEESLKIEKYRLEQGLITQQEYANKETEFKLSVLQLQEQQRVEQDNLAKERAAMDAANLKELQAANMQNDFDLKQMQLDAQYQQEMEAAEKLGADTTLVQARYEKAKEDLTKARVNAELTMTAGLAGQMSDLLGEESAAGKAFAVVQATINTYLGATKALSQGGILGIAQAAIVIAFGMKQVASIVKTKEPETKIDTGVKKYAKGGQIFGKRHSQGGVTFRGDNGQVFEAEGGENVYIMNRSASAEINALSSLNEKHGGNSFGASGLYKFADGGMVSGLSTSSPTINVPNDVRLSPESINMLAGVVIDAIQNAPNPVVTVQDINSGQNDVQVVQNLATY